LVSHMYEKKSKLVLISTGTISGVDGDDIDGMTTMFHLTKIVAQKLKMLFSFISETLVQKTTAILNTYSKADFEKVSETKVVNLICQMLEALTAVFTYNQVNLSKSGRKFRGIVFLW